MSLRTKGSQSDGEDIFCPHDHRSFREQPTRGSRVFVLPIKRTCTGVMMRKVGEGWGGPDPLLWTPGVSCDKQKKSGYSLFYSCFRIMLFVCIIYFFARCKPTGNSTPPFTFMQMHQGVYVGLLWISCFIYTSRHTIMLRVDWYRVTIYQPKMVTLARALTKLVRMMHHFPGLFREREGNANVLKTVDGFCQSIL